MSNWKSLLTGSLMLTLLMVFPMVLAQDTGLVGVEVGDWVKYGVKRSGQPSAWFPYKDVEWVKIEVQSVSGVNVTVRETDHKTDGREWNMTVSCDARRLAYLWVIPANLSAGDEIRVSPHLAAINGSDKKYIEALQINSTVWRTYGGVSREVNLLKFSYVLPYFWYMYNFSEAYCWDKETGFLLEETVQSYALGYGNASLSTRTLEIVDTNLWEMEAQPNWSQGLLGLLGVAVVLSAVVVASVFYKRRNKRT